MDALIDLIVPSRLCCPISVRPHLAALTFLRISTVLPQRRPSRRRYVRGLCVNPDMVEYLPEIGALGD